MRNFIQNIFSEHVSEVVQVYLTECEFNENIFRYLVLKILKPRCMGLVLYNDLSNDIENICSPSLFKRKLRHYIVDKCSYSLNEFL